MLNDYIEKKPVIETNRLFIRPMNIDDIDSLKKWLPDKTLYKYWGKGPSKSELNPELLFQKQDKPTKSFHEGIALKDTNEIIGDIYVYLIENNRMASVAIRISKEFQSKGYGTETIKAMTNFCFKNTELQRLWAGVDVRNTSSWKMLEKCGYVREGLIRQGKMVNTWCDYYIYGILKQE